MSSDELKRRWGIYQFPPSFILGFHGCDKKVGEDLLGGKITHLNPSTNDYDWLGTGIYFWEANPQRALEFAIERAASKLAKDGEIMEPFVISAIINLGRCLDLRDSAALMEVRDFYEGFHLSTINADVTVPKNTGRELKLRRLDCAVMNFLHSEREDAGWPGYDTVRADFWEGDALYPDAGFREQDHIQICVRNENCVLGYFRPIE